MAKTASKSKKASPSRGEKKSFKGKKKAVLPKRKKGLADVVDPFGGDPFELPKR